MWQKWVRNCQRMFTVCLLRIYLTDFGWQVHPTMMNNFNLNSSRKWSKISPSWLQHPCAESLYFIPWSNGTMWLRHCEVVAMTLRTLPSKGSIHFLIMHKLPWLWFFHLIFVFWFLICDWQDQNQRQQRTDISVHECNRIYNNWLFRRNKKAKNQGEF